MNPYVTGAVIRDLREKKHMTQAEMAEQLGVSDKAVSKWETGRGYPDITLLPAIADVFGISLTELLSGETVQNMNMSANMLRGKFYVCPVCGNILHGTGEAVIICHGIRLMPLETEEIDEAHAISVERMDDEYYVEISHEMTKSHYISFVAAVGSDMIQTVKMYPEGASFCRLQIRGVRRIYYYCNKHGLFCMNVK